MLSAVGSLIDATLRFANQDETSLLRGHFEVISLAGTLSSTGSHLHLAISDSAGATLGGHLKEGSKVYTTLEIVLGILDGWHLSTTGSTMTKQPSPRPSKEGYASFFAGKWHLGPTEEFWPEKHGYDVNKAGYKAGGPYTGKRYFPRYDNLKMENGPDGEHLPDRLASETCMFMETNKEKPFFAMLSLYSVHTPLIGRPDLVAKYKKKAAKINGQEFGDEEQVFGKKPRKVRILQ